MENIESEQKLPMTEEEKKMYNKAKRRVSFKVHFTIYFLCIALFWLLWVFLFKDSVNEGETSVFFRLTLALTLFWGIFVFAHYLIVYKWNKSYIEKEIKRLKKQQAKQEEELKRLTEEENEEVE
ncbi:MAG: 2TM domain-containing protein [Bacteroidales bacterium]|jgi:predicted membrane protein|nr:2TM domain-containing protein [Bacteroidales bacterium]